MRPRAGTRGTVRSRFDSAVSSGFTVDRVEGNLCWSTYDTKPNASEPFIWRFNDGTLNALHDWPHKDEAEGTPNAL